MDRYAERGVEKLAGNGHVRNDIGVPSWLSASTRQLAKSIAFLEPGEAPPADAYDQTVALPEQPRDDPCKTMTPPQKVTAKAEPLEIRTPDRQARGRPDSHF